MVERYASWLAVHSIIPVVINWDDGEGADALWSLEKHTAAGSFLYFSTKLIDFGTSALE